MTPNAGVLAAASVGMDETQARQYSDLMQPYNIFPNWLLSLPRIQAHVIE